MDIKHLVTLPNIAEELSKDKLEAIGISVVNGYELDKASRADWEDWYARSLKLALQVMEQKTFPWVGASNVKFPLLTVASLHFHAKAYPALLSMENPVQCRVPSIDPDGIKTARAKRISQHMSYQIMEEDEKWEENHDKMLLSLPIVGTAFKKCYFDSTKRHNVSELILARDLVVNYYTKSIETAPRITHVIYFSKNDIIERIRKGIFCDEELSPNVAVPHQDVMTDSFNASQKMYPQQNDETTPYEFYEQYTWLDLDEDGYAEPYIVTVCKNNAKVYRIVANYYEDDITFNRKKEVVSINPGVYFVKYGFIPSPDGGFYDIGLGLLLGPLNESVNTTINQLIDNGTLKNLGGGFLGRGVKIKGGDYSFKPGEWKRAESTGEDLHKSIVPLPVTDPSSVLLQMLTFLINYGERVAGATEIQVGENPGQNTPAETMRTMNENGQRIFNGIYKRIWRSMKEEFRRLYVLNKLFFEANKNFEEFTGGQLPFVAHQDYRGPETDVRPSADPNVVSDEQRTRQSMTVMQHALQLPGHNVYEAVKRVYESLKVPAIEQVFPDPKGPNAIPPQPNAKMMEVQLKEKKLQLEEQQQKIDMQMKVMELQGEAQLNAAKILELQARAMKHVEEAKGVKDGHTIAMIEAQIGAAKAHQDNLIKTIDVLMKGVKDATNSGAKDGLGQTPSNQGAANQLAGVASGIAGKLGGQSLPVQ